MNQRQKLVQQQFLNDEEKIIKRLHLTYSQSLAQVNEKIKNLQFSIDGLQQEYDWMDDSDPKKAQVKSQIQSKIYQKQYQEQLQKQLDGILDKMNTQQYLSVSDYLENCYEDGFVGTMFDMHGQGVPLMIPMDQEAMVRAVQLESKISEGLYTRLGEDVDQLKIQIRAQVSRGIATGMSYAQTAKQLANYSRIGYNRSIRIARTEGHRIQTTAAMDACHKAKERGADVLKQWDATLDDVTRESHRQVDGEIRELDESFSNGLGFPGDPAGGAGEVINCRCAILQRARWALGEDELHILEERAAYYGLDKAETFDDFKKKYLKAVSEPQVVEPVKHMFTPAKTINEAEEFIKQYVDEKGFGAIGVSYKGIDVEVANELNRTLSEFYETFDVEKFGGIMAPAGNTKLGKMMTGATAAYMPIRNSILLNRNSMKNMKTAIEAFNGETAVLKNLLEHPERYDFTKLSKRVLDTVERAKISGRATVPTSIEEAVNHELGHMLEKKVYKSPLWGKAQANMAEHASKISGYAGESKSEYVAESFASYMKGETVADPIMVEIFENLKR